MENACHKCDTPVNARADGPPQPPDPTLHARNKSLEACALTTALAEALAALPTGTVDETLQALATVCERTCREAFAAVEAIATTA